jgi:hypothetical protein
MHGGSDSRQRARVEHDAVHEDASSIHEIDVASSPARHAIEQQAVPRRALKA